jgi:cyclophilin family peptidyl-prolyl cis-trans isomerase
MLLAAMRRSAITTVLLLAIVALLAGCGGSKKHTTTSAKAAATTSTATTPATTGTTSTTPASGPCRTVPQPPAKGAQHLPKPTLRLDPGKRWTATMATNCGSFTIALDVKHAPKTSASFVSLAKKGFYDQLTFHRIAPGFVIQGGDPNGDGSGGPGYTVVEPPPSSTQYGHGVVAMAKAGNEPAGASGSQFFVMLGDEGLPPEYAILGKVVKGLGVVDAIGKLPLSTNDPMGSAPVDPVVIQSVKVQSR